MILLMYAELYVFVVDVRLDDGLQTNRVPIECGGVETDRMSGTLRKADNLGGILSRDVSLGGRGAFLCHD